MLRDLKFIMRSCILLFLLIIKAISIVNKREESRILVYGWYGTETLGDKLILLGVLKKLVSKKRSILVCSMDPKYTKHTLRELIDLALDDDARSIRKYVSVVSEQHLLHLSKGDTLVFGGGPLMDDPRLLFWVFVNWIAKIHKCSRIIWGCGIGPVRSKVSRAFIQNLVKNQDHVVLRPSFNLNSTVEIDNYDIALCPSFLCRDEIREYVNNDNDLEIGFSVNLRFLPPSYVPKNYDTSHYNDIYFLGMARLLELNTNLDEISFFSTHELDWRADSEAAAKVSKLLGVRYNCDSLLIDVIKNIASSEFVIATRYHGFVLGLLLGKKTIGVDYTPGGGKLGALCDYLKYNSSRVSIEDIIAENVRIDLGAITILDLDAATVASDAVYNCLVQKL